MAESFTNVNPDPVYTGIVQSYGYGGQFAFEMAVPIRTVSGKKFQYAKWNFADTVSQHHETKMPDNGPANKREHRGLTWTPAVCVAHGLKEEWGDTERGESALTGMELDHERSIWEDLANELGMGIEAEFKAALEAASNATTCTGVQQWDDSGTGANILSTFDLAIKGMRHACGFNPNLAIVPEDCYIAMINDSTIQGLLKYTNPDMLNMRGGAPPVIRGCQIIVPTRVSNSAKPGATASIAEQWASDKVYFLHVNMAAATNPRVPTAAFLAKAMTLPGADGSGPMNFAADSWRPYDRDCLWTNYAVTTNRKLIVQDELIYRLDDVLE